MAVIPVTLIEATRTHHPLKTPETDGYRPCRWWGHASRRLINKPSGHLAKAKVEGGRGLWELRVEDDKLATSPSAAKARLTSRSGPKVDVQGVTKGKLPVHHQALELHHGGRYPR